MESVKTRLQMFFWLLLVVMMMGTVGFMAVEKLTLADALYFSIVTIATVGYGDIHPDTTAGKALAILLIILGVGIFLGVVANATDMMLHQREKKTRLAKLNMAIGVFFSELGTPLLRFFSVADAHLEKIRPALLVTGRWQPEDFARLRRRLNGYRYRVAFEDVDLRGLHALLASKTGLLLRLLENPLILEHETFTQLLWAAFHLSEELKSRPGLEDLPRADRAHLAGDMNRAYGLLARQWAHYMEHLKERYPYLFSLSMRLNPFDAKASAVVRDEEAQGGGDGPKPAS